MTVPLKPVVWLGSSRQDLRACPLQVRRDIGQALYAAQQGGTDPAAKPLSGFGNRQVFEIVERYRTDAYRAVYTVQFRDVLYVLHVFQKKSKRGRATPRRDVALIQQRLKEAERHYRERQH
jgi:phage-related protein